MARETRRAVGTARQRQRRTLPAARGGSTPDHRGATRPPQGGPRIRERSGPENKNNGTPRRLGCNVLRAEECFTHGTCRRGCATARGTPTERCCRAGRTGALRPSTYWRKSSGRDDQQVGGG